MKRFILLLCLLFGGAWSASAQVAVIVHPDVPESSLDTKKIQALYELDEEKWSDGTRVVLFDQKDDVASTGTFYAALGRSHGDFKKVWLRKKLSGEGHPPAQLSSDEEMVAKVASTPGAIGFVDPGAVTNAVKVVATLQ